MHTDGDNIGTYEECDRPTPTELKWGTPAGNAGQTVTIEYGDYGSEGTYGAPYRRITDRSDGSVSYYYRSDLPGRAPRRR